MVPFKFVAHSESDTQRLGTALAGILPDGTTIALIGTLGAGKTRLVQAVAGALGITSGQVTSPTFVLCQEYHGSRSIYHFDAYRIEDDDEFLELGVDEYVDEMGLKFIEWADRVTDCLPVTRIEIVVEVLGERSRGFTINQLGRWPEDVVSELSRRLNR